jgi:hypothetical protein
MMSQRGLVVPSSRLGAAASAGVPSSSASWTDASSASGSSAAAWTRSSIAADAGGEPGAAMALSDTSATGSARAMISGGAPSRGWPMMSATAIGHGRVRRRRPLHDSAAAGRVHGVDRCSRSCSGLRNAARRGRPPCHGHARHVCARSARSDTRSEGGVSRRGRSADSEGSEHRDPHRRQRRSPRPGGSTGECGHVALPDRFGRRAHLQWTARRCSRERWRRGLVARRRACARRSRARSRGLAADRPGRTTRMGGRASPLGRGLGRRSPRASWASPPKPRGGLSLDEVMVAPGRPTWAVKLGWRRASRRARRES